MDSLRSRQAYQRANSSNDPNEADVEMVQIATIPKGNDSETTPAASTSVRPPIPALQPPKSHKVKSRICSSRFAGWRTGAYIAASVALISVCFNIAAAVWLKRHPSASSDLVEVYRGSCAETSRLGLWVHLAINAISTLLLSGSNYCMQCLCAPTRKEVDQAHLRGRFLDIGVVSFRNLYYISRHKAFLWWVLVLSSLPLHLLYNSAFYSSITTNDYSLFVVTQDFFNGTEIRMLPNISSDDMASEVGLVNQLQQEAIHNKSAIFDQLSPLDCVKAYAEVFLQDYSNLIMVTSNNTGSSDSSVLHTEMYDFGQAVNPEIQVYRPFNWICVSDPNIGTKISVPTLDNGGSADLAPCDTYVNEIENIINDWQPWGVNVEYCLAQRTQQRCSFNGNIPIIDVVIAANVIKIVVMLFVAMGLSDSPLITLGDALESFLVTRDECSKGLCLLTRVFADIPVSRDAWSPPNGDWSTLFDLNQKDKLLIAETEKKHWHSAASLRRWAVVISLIVLALLVCQGFFVAAIRAMQISGVPILDLGFGEIHASAVISGWSITKISNPASQIVAAIFIANLPQLILSLLYFNLNGLLTTMWMASEWSSFATQRKTLRVSTPKAKQRSSHFLSLPYKVAISLMIISGLLHWLVSQSIFLAVLAVYNQNGTLQNSVAIASCGFSPIAMICVVIVGVLILFGTVLVGRRKLNPTIPVVGSCSIAISAACHRPDWDINAATNAVQWGVVPSMSLSRRVGHCCFTNGEVEPIVRGRLYAGIQ